MSDHTNNKTLFFVFACISIASHAQSYSDLQIKEHSDKLFESAYNNCLIDNQPCASTDLGNNLGDRIGDVLTSLLHLYRTTGDKAYLIKFINITIKAQAKRNDVCGDPTWHEGWVNFADGTNVYRDGHTVAPMAEYVYMVKNDDALKSTPLPQSNNIITIPSELTSLTSANIATYGAFAQWLGTRVEETIDYFLNNGYWSDTEGLKHDNGVEPPPVHGRPVAINQQAGFATALLYMGLTGNGNPLSKYYQYRVRASLVAAKYMGSLSFYDYKYCQTFSESVMKLYPDNSYWWYDNTWEIPVKSDFECCFIFPLFVCVNQYDSYDRYTEYIEDISYAISTLKFPLAVYKNYSGLFSLDDMIKWRNTFTKRIFNGYSGNTPTFNQSVIGSGQIYVGYLTQRKNYSLAYMPFYQFDDDVNETPYAYYIIMDFYKNDFRNQSFTSFSPSCSAGGLQGNQYYGLAEVVAAQWDKECANLTLYNRDVVYDQEFFVKNTLTIAPQQTTDAYYTPQPFAEPQTFTDGGAQDRFIIEPNTTVNLKAGEQIVLKKGFHAKAKSNFHAYLDPALKTECQDGVLRLMSSTQNTTPSDPVVLQTTTPASKKNPEKELKEEESISNNGNKNIISPNPSSGIFTLMSNHAVQSVEVRDMLGNIVYRQAINSTSINMDVDLSSQPKGIYVLHVKGMDKIYTEKIVTQ